MLWQKIAANVFLCGETSTVPEQRRLSIICFCFSFPKLYKRSTTTAADAKITNRRVLENRRYCKTIRSRYGKQMLMPKATRTKQTTHNVKHLAYLRHASIMHRNTQIKVGCTVKRSGCAQGCDVFHRSIIPQRERCHC